MKVVHSNRLIKIMILFLLLFAGFGCNLVTFFDVPPQKNIDAPSLTPFREKPADFTPTSSLEQTPETAAAAAVQQKKIASPTVRFAPATPQLETPAAATATVTTTPDPVPTLAAHGVERIIGYSAGELPIASYQFKNGPVKIIFVGGIHGGWEYNTTLLAYEAIDYFAENIEAVPNSISLTIIPAANPDGLQFATGRVGRFEKTEVISNTLESRFNGNHVDVNRNWDCDWSESPVWRHQPIDGGAYPFSEPESRALRDFFLEQDPAAVIFWHSTANAVYAAKCPHLFGPSRELAELYGEAAGYPVFDTFTAYPITGDASDWLAKQKVPAISVELASGSKIEWIKNRNGIMAVLDYFALGADSSEMSTTTFGLIAK